MKDSAQKQTPIKSYFPHIPLSTPSIEFISKFLEKRQKEQSEDIGSLDFSNRSLFLEGPLVHKSVMTPQINDSASKLLDPQIHKSIMVTPQMNDSTEKPNDPLSFVKKCDSPTAKIFTPQLSNFNFLGAPRRLKTLIAKEKMKSLYDVITNLYLAKKFIRLLQMTTIRKPKFLGETHFRLIGDMSFDLDSFQKDNFLHSSIKQINSKSKNLLLQCTGKIRPFEPFSQFIFFWNFLHLIIFCFLFIRIPIDLSFQVHLFEKEFELPKWFKFLIQIFTLLFYLFDIILNFHTAYYDNGELIIDKSQISKKYRSSSFYLDICSLIAILLWVTYTDDLHNSISVFSLFYFVKIFKIKHIFDNIEELCVVNEYYFHCYSLIILLIRIFVVGHIAACLWHFLGISFEDSWLSIDPTLKAKSWEVRYLYSFYFIIITMNTVGYGDISPKNTYEVGFCIGFVIIGCMMFAYTLNCMGNIFHSFYKKEREFKEELFTINSFMKSKNIPRSFQIKVRKYLEHIWISEKQANFEKVKPVFTKLSESLKNELLLEANGNIVNKIELFKSNFSQKTLNSIVKIMKEESFSPGEVIFLQDDHKNHDLFFIKKGTVEIFVENELSEKRNSKLLKTLKDGEVFGEISFFSEMNRLASARK